MHTLPVCRSDSRHLNHWQDWLSHKNLKWEMRGGWLVRVMTNSEMFDYVAA